MRRLAELVADVVKHPGDIVFDPHPPDGKPRKLLESRIRSLGWNPKNDLPVGVETPYRWFVE